MGDVDIAVGGFHEGAHEVLYVAAHVSGFGKFRGVGLDEGNPYELGDRAHEVGFAHARGAQYQNVLLGILPLGEGGVFHAAADVVVVVADCHGEDFFRLVLLYYKFVEIVAYLARLHRKFGNFFENFLRGAFLLRSAAAVRRGRAERGDEFEPDVPVLAENPLELLFQLFERVAFRLVFRLFFRRVFCIHLRDSHRIMVGFFVNGFQIISKKYGNWVDFQYRNITFSS